MAEIKVECKNIDEAISVINEEIGKLTSLKATIPELSFGSASISTGKCADIMHSGTTTDMVELTDALIALMMKTVDILDNSRDIFQQTDESLARGY